jgi:hypothetical protein
VAAGGKNMESSELLKLIRDEIQHTIQSPTADWKTVAQWGTEWGLQRAQTARMLSVAVRAGIMEHKRFRLSMPMRHSYPVPHYRKKVNP